MLENRIPPPVYALLAGTAIAALHRYLPGPTLFNAHVAHWAWLVSVPGGLLALWAIVTFRHAQTTLDPTAPSRASRLVTYGPYRITRNPMYLGLVLALLGWAGWLGNLSNLLVLPLFIAVVTHQQILPEEKALETLFGDEYVRYRQQVNRWLGRRENRAET